MNELKMLFENYELLQHKIQDLSAIVQNPNMSINEEQLIEFATASDNLCSMINSNKDKVLAYYRAKENEVGMGEFT